MVSIQSLDNLDSFKTQTSAVKKFLTVKKPKFQQYKYPKNSIFNMVSIKSLNMDSFKSQVLTVKKFLTIKKFLSVLKPKSQHT